MLPIYVMHDTGLTVLESTAVSSGIQSALACLGQGGHRRRVEDFGAKAWAKGEFSSADWYVSQAKHLRRSNGIVQLDADDLIGLMANEPWQDAEPHIDVMFTSYDLTVMDDGRYLNFVFGLADGRFTVQSVARFRSIPDEFDRVLAIKAVVQHELGHIFGMASDLHRSNIEYSLGPHCTNRGCVMRQALNVPDWAQNARDSYQMGMIYCPQCLEDAKHTLI